MTSIVGESNYQDAIRKIGVYDDVFLIHEPENTYDARAIRVESSYAETIGYLPRDGWLTKAILDQGKPAKAWVASVEKGEGNYLGVALEVGVGKEVVEELAAPLHQSSGCMPLWLAVTMTTPVLLIASANALRL